ncbi:hypothetical protein GALL_65670 [mine drainage metagenome]|uniref:Uncharacterized protein n=1 Tax=mine drainage metagenome TaxID=410659 RepID=A0A1J5STA4_9ZZZZ
MEKADKKLEFSDEETKWGEPRKDNFGYTSDQERLEKRGLEDWELVEKIPDSQQKVPYWFMAVVVIVLLVGVGLSFPFWGLRPGVVVNWVDWVKDPGFLGSLVYIAVAAAFVHYMVNMYGSKVGGRLDSDIEKRREEKDEKEK